MSGHQSPPEPEPSPCRTTISINGLVASGMAALGRAASTIATANVALRPGNLNCVCPPAGIIFGVAGWFSVSRPSLANAPVLAAPARCPRATGHVIPGYPDVSAVDPG
jgi:hypothetical protein